MQTLARYSLFVGIDVSARFFDVHARRVSKAVFTAHYPNTKAGFNQLITALRLHGGLDAAHVVMEATGTYHRRLARALYEAGLALSVVNPLSIKRFAQMKLKRTKTDAADAALIATYAQDQEPALWQMPSRVQDQVKQITTTIDHLNKQRTMLVNLMHASAQLPEVEGCCQSSQHQVLKTLDREIARLKAHQVQLIETELGWCRTLIQSIKGIGPRTALGLLGYCGDLSGFQGAKQLVAYIGINSGIYQSGGRVLGTSSISKQGPRRLRCLFYLAALSASQHNRSCRLLYERLLEKGKPKKVALIAVANKLVRQVFAVVKSQVPYQDEYELKRRHRTQRTSKKNSN